MSPTSVHPWAATASACAVAIVAAELVKLAQIKNPRAPPVEPPPAKTEPAPRPQPSLQLALVMALGVDLTGSFGDEPLVLQPRLLIGAELLVEGAIEIARQLGITEVVIGITLVAIGTSLPELAVSLVSAMKGEYGLAIGNIVGSNIFNLLAVIGIAAAIDPSALSPTVLSLHIFVMVAFTLVLFAMTYDYDGKADLSRLEGVALLGAYICYFGYVVSQTIQ